MKAVKKVLTLLLILTIISQIFIPSNVKAQNTIRTYDSNSLYDEVAKNAVLDNKRSEYVDSDTGIDFTKGASSTNGQGVYTIASTKDDLYPIHYYRGNIDNNNVLFGGFCWQIVRTTETGGVKLIYNGSPDENGKCEDTRYDSSLYSGNGNLYMLSESFSGNLISKVYDDYNIFDAIFSVTSGSGAGTIYDAGTTYDFDLFSNDVDYDIDSNRYILKNPRMFSKTNIDEIKNTYPIYSCGQYNSCSEVSVIDWSYFQDNDSYFISNYLEFERGLTYDSINDPKILFANDVEFKDGTYTLKNPIDIIPYLSFEEEILHIFDETLFNGHHYFCSNFSNSCKEVIYFYYNKIYNKFDYIYFKDGEKVDDIYNSYYHSENKYDSGMKKIIDKWYANELLSYDDKLEDVVWYNDKSNVVALFNKNSPIKDNNKITASLKYINKNDMFTVSDKIGNGKLKYPTATITAQEAIYAGSPFAEEDESSIKTFSYVEPYSYLSSNYEFYTMTPSTYFLDKYHSENEGFVISYSGALDIESPSCVVLSLDLGVAPIVSSGCGGSYAVRPMVSLKHSMVVSSGDGSPTNPYEVVEGNTVEYVIDGDMPKGFLPPEVGSYLKGSKVKMNGLKAGDIVNGYRFLGWHTEDVEVEGDTFDMPENKVVFVGKFEKIEDSPLTYDSIGKYLTTGIIGVVGLFGLVLLKKKI